MAAVTAVLTAAALIVAALGASLVATPPAAADAVGPRRPAAGPTLRAGRIVALPAVRSGSVVDAYGVGIHLNFLDTPYLDYQAVADALSDLGVRHVRDDLYLDAPREYRAIRAVAARGIGFDLIMGRPGTGATPTEYVETVADHLPVGSVDALEGANEWDLFGGGDHWPAEVTAWQRDLFTAARAEPATAGIPVLAPALAFSWSYADLGDLSAWSDLANAHMYPGGYEPSAVIGQITQAVRTVVPTAPLVTTEAGYTNAVNGSGHHLPVPEDVSATYLPRLLLDHVLAGERRVYSYELIDSFDDPGATDTEAHFGLLRHDLSPKPAYTAMRSLLALLADPGPTFTPGRLAVTADGLPTDARYLLTQRRDGRFVLLLWRDVRVFDPQEQTPLTVTSAAVTLRFATSHRLTVHRPTDGPRAVASRVGTTLPLRLGGQVVAITVDPVRPPAPTGVSARPGPGRAVLSWRLPPTSARVTGFQVVRTGPGPDERWRLRPGARSLRDRGLRDGRRYAFRVRTTGRDGSSRAVVVRVVPG
ncbi:hypothetical protein [Nocardioides sp.]|uniref:hypothetical protein n=1 Tax=Nocardioides sp. TaxID=35761 RepID=UPI00378313AA